jgi:Rps23 Pro-64 3,4-dihydroxylase Tpa1-like proline 4-hydroxylase
MAVTTSEHTRWASLENPGRLAELLCARIEGEASRLRAEFGPPGSDRIRYCFLDRVLPESVMSAAYDTLPRLSDMIRLKNMKERKFLSADLDRLSPSIADVVLAFAQPKVADIIGWINGGQKLQPDPDLYNGGITVMLPGDHMCPHLDNSHDRSRIHRRDVVLLYYLTPSWLPAYGGSLELWDMTRRKPQAVIEFCPNRLVMMETTNKSWHAVRAVTGCLPRASVTSYFYASENQGQPVRLTRFASWPGHPLKGLLFNGQFYMRSAASKVVGRSIGNKHVYTRNVMMRRQSGSKSSKRP